MESRFVRPARERSRYWLGARAAACALSLVAALAPAAGQVADSHEARVALVIGNAAYRESPLKNPVNDAHDVAAKLRTLGFEVVYRENLKIKEIGSTLREFRNKLSPGAVALVFYAGHGLQIKGVNYLPTVDADIGGEEDVPNESLDVNLLLSILDDSKTQINILFLDACRNNPFQRNFRSLSTGLAKVDAPSGTLISFATRPGGVSADGSGRNGLYTQVLLENIDEPNVPVETLLKRIVLGVRNKSNGQQEPWMEGSITGDFYFRSAAAAPPAQAASTALTSTLERSSAQINPDELQRKITQLQLELQALRDQGASTTGTVTASTPAPAARGQPPATNVTSGDATTPAPKPASKPAVAAATPDLSRPGVQSAAPALAQVDGTDPGVHIAASRQPTAPRGTGSEVASIAPPAALVENRAPVAAGNEPSGGPNLGEVLDSQGASLTLVKTLAILAGSDQPSELGSVVQLAADVERVPYSSAFALGLSPKGVPLGIMMWGQRGTSNAMQSAKLACEKQSGAPCLVVWSNGALDRSACVEYGRLLSRSSNSARFAKLVQNLAAHSTDWGGRFGSQ